jgi:hypothetical protein
MTDGGVTATTEEGMFGMAAITSDREGTSENNGKSYVIGGILGKRSVTW